MKLLKLEDFPLQSYDKLRFGDTDRQGHVNNAVFTTLLETGRVGLLQRLETFDRTPGLSFVIARLCVDYRKEIFWPGTVEVGTGVTGIGRSSVTFAQSLFQNGDCVATAESVLVQVQASTHRSTALDEDTKTTLAALLIAKD